MRIRRAAPAPAASQPRVDSIVPQGLNPRRRSLPCNGKGQEGMRCGLERSKSAAVPATVSEEPPAGGHWTKTPGKAARATTREPGDLPSTTNDPTVRRVSRARSPDLMADSSFSGKGPTVSVPGEARAGVDHPRLLLLPRRDRLGRPSPRRRDPGASVAACRAASADTSAVRSRSNASATASAASAPRILRDGCWSYVFGDLDRDSGADLVTGAKLFATSTDGLLPWRGRPDALKRGLVARIPPSLSKDLIMTASVSAAFPAPSSPASSAPARRR